MTTATPYPLRLPEMMCPLSERTSSGHDLEDALDAWLSDDFAHEDYLHVHSWNDDEEIARWARPKNAKRSPSTIRAELSTC